MAKDKREIKIVKSNATIVRENYKLYVRFNAKLWYVLNKDSEIMFPHNFEQYYQSKRKK